MRMMMNSCVKKNESGEYVFTKSSLLSEFDGIIEKRAISDGADALITEDGKKIQIVEKALENKAYSVFFSGNSPIAIAESFYVLGHSLVPIYSGTELLELGACVEYTVPVPAKEYTACIGHFDTETFVFTANNVHYPVNENAFDKAVYMLDAKISDKSVIDYAKPVIFVSSFGSTAINPTLENIFCVYQLSSNVLADYSAFNVALDAAKAINNDGGVYLQSAYESFLASVDAIDFSLAKDLTDTEGSRLLISEATGALNAAMAELENYRIESYDELDAEMLRAQEYIPRAGEYTAESFTKLQEALENAQLLSRELLVSDESKAIIASHKGAISAAIAGLKYSTECDYGPYDATLKIALDITNTNGKYSDSDFADFQKTVNDIDKKLERNLPRTDANQRKVDDARKAILDAIEKLNSKLPCNYDALEKAIHEAENLIKDDPTNSTHRWVSYVFTAFADALGKAKAIDRNMTLGYGNTNQMEIDSAATGLFNATENT